MMQHVTQVFLAMILWDCYRLCAGQVQSVNCNQFPCRNGGTCLPFSVSEGSQMIDSFVCQCPSGTLQPSCDSRINIDCSTYDPCMNGGTCLDVGSNQCFCSSGYVLPFCGDDCRSTPCQNGGICTHYGLCLCLAGYTGTSCEQNIVDVTCPDNTTVIEHGTRVTYTASCMIGTFMLGLTCDVSSGTELTSTTQITCTCDMPYSHHVCTFTVVVNSPPVISNCPDSVTVTQSVQDHVTISYSTPSCTDVEDEIIIADCNPPSGQIPISPTTNFVTCTCTDSQGSEASCTISIPANAPPLSPQCPDDMDYIRANGNGVQVTFGIPTCVDEEQQTTLTAVCSPTSGVTFTSTVTMVICTCTDLNGLTSSCSFSISVQGVQCPSNQFATAQIGSITPVEATWSEPDNPTSFLVIHQTHDSGDFFPVGDTTVTYTFRDQAGNEASCSFTVTVVEDCTILNDDQTCTEGSCQCGVEVCNTDTDICSRSCSVFECPTDLQSSSLSKGNPPTSADINCILTGSGTLLDRISVGLSRKVGFPLDTRGISSMPFMDINEHSRQITYRVSSVTEEEDLHCVLTKGTFVIGSVNVTGFLYVLPRLSAAPDVIFKSNTSVAVRWEAWDPVTDVGDPNVTLYLPYYRRNSSDVSIPGQPVLSGDILEFRAEDLEVDTVYEFSVAAVREGENGEGPRSPSVTVKTFCNVPNAAPEVIASLIPSNGVNVSWQLPFGDVMCSTGVTKFTVYYKVEGSINEGLQVAGTVDDTNSRWYIIDGASLTPGMNYSFFVTFTTDQQSPISEITEGSILQVPLISSGTSGPAAIIGAAVGVIIVILLSVVALVLIKRHRRENNSENKKTTIVVNGEDSDYVNAAAAGDDPEDYIPLEAQSKTISSSKYENFNVKPQSSISIPPRYEVTIVPEPQKPVATARIQTRNTKEVKSSAYENVGASSERRHLPDVSQTHPSGDEGENTIYEVPDMLEEYTGVYVNLKNKKKPVQPGPIKVAEFQKFMSRKKEEVVKDIVHQFLALPSGAQYQWNVALKFQNKPRNFYKTILPYDHSRVKLDTAGSDARSDYINANYIKNQQGQTSFIAAQGPQEGTVDDFWMMVWEENVEIIVMVTENFEKNKLLCCTYWPSKVHMGEVYGDITVILMESTSYTTHTIRKMNLLKGNHKPEAHSVTQVQVHSWPYGGVPSDATSLMSIVKEVKTWQAQGGSSPFLVHCSNGAGATGTFIAVYVLMDIIRKNKDISIFSYVAKMRKDRVDMVQTKIQYLFIFEFLLAVLQSTDSVMSSNQLKKLDHAAIKVKSEKEFRVLQKSTVNQQQLEDCVGNTPENQHKNRFSAIIPGDKFRPVLKSQGSSYGCNSYIHAFHVADFGGTEFIMTQTPLSSTVEDFWRLVYDYECTTIVMLNTIDDSNETVVQYWPGGGSAQYGLMKVVCADNTRNYCFIHSQFTVAHKKVEEKSISVDHFAFCGWSGNQPDVSKLMQFIRYTGNKGPGPVLVHCINGIGLSGVFIIAKAEMKRLESTGSVDIFQTLQRLRKICPFAVQTQEEYALCYQLLKDHLENPEEYAVVY